MEKNNEIIFKETDKRFWEQPQKHALVKGNLEGKDIYTIFTLSSPLMMFMCDDFEYAEALARKMIEHHVTVYNSAKELVELLKK